MIGMQNGYGHGTWKKALKNMTAIATGIILGQQITHPDQFADWTIFRHSIRTIVLTIFFAELAYFHNWLASPAAEKDNGKS